MDDERVFSLGDAFFVHLRRIALGRVLPLIVLALAVGLLVHPPGVQVEAGFLLFTACVLLPLGLFGAWRGFRRLIATFEGYRLFVSHDRLRRVQPGLPEMEIARGEVTRIVEVPGKGLTVFGTGHQKFIGVPAGLDGFEEVRALLATWCSFEERRGALASWFPILAGLLGVVAFAVVIGSENRLLVTALGLGLIALQLYCVIVLPRSPQVDSRTKKAIWFFPFIILAVALRIWTVWHPM